MRLIALLAFFVFLHSVSYSQVVMRDTTIQFQHFDFEMNEFYGLESYSDTDIVTTSFNGIVLENELVKICIIPEFGARIISFIYKPTGKEQLYQNPIGTPYQINTGVFYHNWLMVYGGIFPTFPGPEHGKYWNTPWKSEITESNDKITLSMSQIDTLNNPQHPGQYGGVTGISCRYNVSLAANEPYFTVDVELENDDTSDDFEYWTCITFAPGSEPGNTFTPGNSEMIVPINKYKMAWNPNNWMAGLDNVVQSNGEYIMEYDKLAHLSNWEDMGIAYAYPTLEASYYGVITHDNEHGLFRISSDQATTPGMKFWTWGNKQGLDADPNDFYNEARPYIELWSGISNEFFQKKFLGAHEKITFTETYFPTVGLAEIEYLSNEIAYSSEIDNNLLHIKTFKPVTTPEHKLNIKIRQNNEQIHSESRNVQVDAAQSSEMIIDLDMLISNEDMAEIEVSLVQNAEVLHSNTSIYQKAILASSAEHSEFKPVLYVNNQTIQLEFKTSQSREIIVYDMNGQVLDKSLTQETKASIPYVESGLYIIKVVENNHIWSKKVLLK